MIDATVLLQEGETSRDPLIRARTASVARELAALEAALEREARDALRRERLRLVSA